MQELIDAIYCFANAFADIGIIYIVFVLSPFVWFLILLLIFFFFSFIFEMFGQGWKLVETQQQTHNLGCKSYFWKIK